MKFPDLMDVANGLLSLASLAHHVNSQAANNLQWQDEYFVALKVNPVVHKLLSTKRLAIVAETDADFSALMIYETLRLASLFFAGLLRDECRVGPAGAIESKSRLVKVLASRYVVDWSSFMDLRLWVLCVAALSDKENRQWYLEEVVKAMDHLELIDWSDALNVLRELIWVDAMQEMEADALGADVANYLVAVR